MGLKEKKPGEKEPMTMQLTQNRFLTFHFDPGQKKGEEKQIR